MSENLTPGEVSRLSQKIQDDLIAFQMMVDKTYLRFDVFEVTKQLSETERSQLSDRLDKLEARSEWMIRLVGAFIVTTVLGVVLAVIKTKAGA
jgi:predicted amino acid-binding ACT domain protein